MIKNIPKCQFQKNYQIFEVFKKKKNKYWYIILIVYTIYAYWALDCMDKCTVKLVFPRGVLRWNIFISKSHYNPAAGHKFRKSVLITLLFLIYLIANRWNVHLIPRKITITNDGTLLCYYGDFMNRMKLIIGRISNVYYHNLSLSVNTY